MRLIILLILLFYSTYSFSADTSCYSGAGSFCSSNYTNGCSCTTSGGHQFCYGIASHCANPCDSPQIEVDGTCQDPCADFSNDSQQSCEPAGSGDEGDEGDEGGGDEGDEGGGDDGGGPDVEPDLDSDAGSDSDCPSGDCEETCPDGLIGTPPFCIDGTYDDPDSDDEPNDPVNPEPDADLNCPAGYAAGYSNGTAVCVQEDAASDSNCSGANQVYGNLNGVFGCHDIEFDLDPNPSPDPSDNPDPTDDSAILNAIHSELQHLGNTADVGNDLLGDIKSNGEDGNEKLDGIGESLDGIDEKLGDPKHECDPTAYDYHECLNGGELDYTSDYDDSQLLFSNQFDGLYSQMLSAPIIQSLKLSNYIKMGSGDCPALVLSDLPLIGSIRGSLHCDVYPSISPIISGLSYAIYLIAAFRIFASA